MKGIWGAVAAQSLYWLGYGLDDRGSIPDRGNDKFFFLFATASRTNLGPTQSPIQWVPGLLHRR